MQHNDGRVLSTPALLDATALWTLGCWWGGGGGTTRPARENGETILMKLKPKEPPSTVRPLRVSVIGRQVHTCVLTVVTFLRCDRACSLRTIPRTRFSTDRRAQSAPCSLDAPSHCAVSVEDTRSRSEKRCVMARRR